MLLSHPLQLALQFFCVQKSGRRHIIVCIKRTFVLYFKLTTSRVGALQGGVIVSGLVEKTVHCLVTMI